MFYNLTYSQISINDKIKTIVTNLTNIKHSSVRIAFLYFMSTVSKVNRQNHLSLE